MVTEPTQDFAVGDYWIYTTPSGREILHRTAPTSASTTTSRRAKNSTLRGSHGRWRTRSSLGAWARSSSITSGWAGRVRGVAMGDRPPARSDGVEWGVLYEDGVDQFTCRGEAAAHAMLAPVPIAVLVCRESGGKWRFPEPRRPAAIVGRLPEGSVDA